MKKIINGKRYDTDSAKCIGSTSFGDSPRDFHYCYEALYQKRTGEFFLYGEGGPLSKYAVSTSYNTRSGSETIRPMTHDEAREWAEKNLDAEEYEQAFAVVEDDETRITTLSLTESVVTRAKAAALARGISLSDYIVGLINQDTLA